MARITTAIRARVESILNSGVDTVNADSVNTDKLGVNKNYSVLYQTSSQAVDPITTTKIDFDEKSENIDVADVSNNLISVNDPGVYFINTQVMWQPGIGTGTKAVVQLNVNGEKESVTQSGMGTDDYPTLGTQKMFQLSADDDISALIRQEEGTTQDTQGGSFNTFLEVVRIG